MPTTRFLCVERTGWTLDGFDHLESSGRRVCYRDRISVSAAFFLSGIVAAREYGGCTRVYQREW